MKSAFVLIALLLVVAVSAFAQNPPQTPLITEPSTESRILNPADVHMETGPFSDPDPNDAHACSDWEIVLAANNELIWEARCKGGVERLHVHLGDGQYLGSHAGRAELEYETNYRLRARHQDNTGLWSAFAERGFRTGSPSEIFPFELADVAAFPLPRLLDETDEEIILPPGNPPPEVRIETSESELLLALRGREGRSNEVVNPPALSHHHVVRVVISGGSSGLLLPATRLAFTNGDGEDRALYFPAMTLAASQENYYWISADGSSFIGGANQTEPNFSQLAQGAAVPWQSLQAGYKVEIFARGLQLPVNIAFIPNAGGQPKDPFFYVTELYGNIKLVARDGSVSDYATGLLNFEPTGDFPGSGEQGLSGIVIEPSTGDVIVALLYDSAPPNGLHYPRVVRFHSNDGGRTAATQATILDMPGESQGQSHFISNLSIGPDGKLYVHMGDGFDASTALNLNSYRGKILRVNLDGTAPSDNPFYNLSDGINARDYVFAYGFRNPFGGDWRAADGVHYQVENGPDRNDRFSKVEAGANYGWNGTGESLAARAIYTWTPPHAPANLAFIQPETFGGSGFPADKMDHAFVTESGSTWASGTIANGKRIVEFVLDASGNLRAGPIKFVEYTGTGKATAVALAAGPDGLYFSDLYKDQNYLSPIDRGANILRVKLVGRAEFTTETLHGQPPLAVQFTDLSNVPLPTKWLWRFGDGDSSFAQNPLHVYQKNGVYTVRLEVSGANGIAVAQKNDFITVGGVLRPGLLAEYYDELDFSGRKITRTDLTVNFDWVAGAPGPGIGADNFSVRWTGFVEPEFSELYTFATVVDDGVRLWIDDQLLINEWVDQAATRHTGTMALSAGKQHRIKMEFYERGGLAVAKLFWSSRSQFEQIIPQERLRHTHYSVTAGDYAAENFSLRQNYPNPLNPLTNIEFLLPRESRVRLIVYDVMGKEVASLISDALYPAGEFAVRWDGREARATNAANGIYFYKIIATPSDRSKVFVETKKLILLR
jgi:glucose/arabinose dehydrogenase